MMRDLIAHLDELRTNLTDPYWRADHQIELMILASILVALIEIPFAYLRAKAYRRGLA